MIYGKISLKNWSVACVEGEEPESFFEGCGLRLFFYGTLYNRDKLRESPDDSNAKLAASAYLADPAHGFARLDGSFTIVYYSKNECGVVRDHHGTHYPVYCNKPVTSQPPGSFWRSAQKNLYPMMPLRCLLSFVVVFCRKAGALCVIFSLWMEGNSSMCLLKDGTRKSGPVYLAGFQKIFMAWSAAVYLSMIPK